MFALKCFAQGPEVAEKWRRVVVELTNPSVEGNPFEVELDGVFTHTESGDVLRLPGYYAGAEHWRLGFMPTRIGSWTYTTSSPDSDLDGRTGTIEVRRGESRGMLKAAPEHPKKWKFADGSFVVPVGALYSVFLEEASDADFARSADFLAETLHGHLFNFRLTNRAFADAAAHRFDLGLWDRLERRMELLTARGLGASVMLYADGPGRPPWSGTSATEKLLIRYTVARLAGYPIVLFNTGIDIAEYRNQREVDWIGARIAALDPYQHPVSSRFGGGSGELVMSVQSFVSLGQKDGAIDPLLQAFADSPGLPLSADDNWGEHSRRGRFRPSDLRRALWKCVIAGGIGMHVRAGAKTDFEGAFDPDAWLHADSIATSLRSAQWLGHVNPFIAEHLGTTFGRMVPSPQLVSGRSRYALADPQGEKILLLVLGSEDRWDKGHGRVGVQLHGFDGAYQARWFDTRTLEQSMIGPLPAGVGYRLRPPDDGDWLLLLEKT